MVNFTIIIFISFSSMIITFMIIMIIIALIMIMVMIRCSRYYLFLSVNMLGADPASHLSTGVHQVSKGKVQNKKIEKKTNKC